MRNLRKFLTRGWISGTTKRRRSATRRRANGSLGRQLTSEALERRELLAGDLWENDLHNYHTAYDVNRDYKITAGDALAVLHELARVGVSGEAAADSSYQTFPDTNDDGILSASDALGVINALGRGEGVGELAEFFLTPRTADDQEITQVNGEYNIPVGEKFTLEVGYADLRGGTDATGAFQIRADIIANLPDYIVPVMTETQRFRFDETAFTDPSLTSITFTQEGTGVTYVADAADWQTNSFFQVLNAMTEFGYTFGTDYEYTPGLTFSDGDQGFLIQWIGDSYDDVDVPDINVSVQQSGGALIEASMTEFSPYLAGPDGIMGTSDDVPNSDAVQFNLDLGVRTWSSFYLATGGNVDDPWFTDLNTGEFDTQRDGGVDLNGQAFGPRPGFIELGGVGQLNPGGVKAADPGFVGASLNDAFSIPVKIVQPVQGLILNVTPSFLTEVESVLLYNRVPPGPLTPAEVILDSYDGVNPPTDNGVQGAVAYAIINGIGENRDPEVSSPITQTFTQNDSQTNVDLLEFASDPDNNTLSVDADSVTFTGDLSGILVSGNEAIVDPGLYSSLAASESEVITISYNIVDGAGGSVAQTATITINGLNDDATGITGDTTGSVTEDEVTTFVATGSLTVADIDNGESEVQPQTDVSGVYGDFSINAAGSWSYTLNNSDPVVQALAAGDAPTETFSVVSKDGTFSVDVIITVNGTNDAPTIGAPVTATFSEEEDVTPVDLLTGASDVDQGDVLNVANYVVTSGNAVGVTQDGNNVDVDPGAYSFLEDGQSEVVVLNYDIVDGNGGSVGQTATITITGVSNFSPVVTVEVGDADTGAVTEQVNVTGDQGTVLTASGTLSFTDQDPDDTHTVSTAETGTGYIGTFSATLTPAVNGLDGEVAWSFSATDADLDELSDGEQRQQVYDVTVTDSNGGTGVRQVIITLNGENDQPQIANPINRTFNSLLSDEDIDLVSAGLDIDGDVLTVETGSVSVGGGDASGVTVDEASGLVTVNPAAYDSLLPGETEVVEVAYTLVDGNGGSVEHTATLTFNGVNDPPVPGPAISETFTQNDGVTTVSLITGATDPDNDPLTVANVSFNPAAPAGLQIVNGDSVEVTPSAYVSLNAGEQAVVEINYVIDDGAGNQTAPQTATITITGLNDSATITGDTTGGVVEDTAVTDGQLTANGVLSVNDVDNGQALFSTSVTGQAGNIGSLEITEAGLWSYSVQNDLQAIQQLADGAQITDEFTVESVDGTAVQNIVITITGVNDIAVISGNNEGGVTEDASNPTLSTSGNLAITDTDAGEAVFSTSVDGVDTPLGNLTIDASGAWNYTLDNTLAAVQQLPEGAQLVDKFEVESFDGETTETITVTITGVNDVPVFGGDTQGQVTEDDNTTLSTSGTLTINDVDTGESLVDTSVSSGVTLGSLTVDSNGAWTYTVDNSLDDIQALVDGEQITEIFTITSIDGSETQAVTIIINGNNDAPEANPDERLALRDDATGILIDALSNDNAGAAGLENQTLTLVSIDNLTETPDPTFEGTQGGSATIENGEIRYIPNTGFEGTATILYTISDGSLTAQGTVTIDVVDFVPSTLSGYVFIDHVENFRDVRDKGADPIRDGIKDEDEKGFASVRIKLVSDNNYTNSPIEREVLTDSEGNFEFTNVVPGEYKVVYEHPEQVRYEGPGEYDVSIPALGDVQRSDLNFGLIGTKGAAMSSVGLLASSYLRTNATIAQISDGGREGGLVCLDETGQQSFIVLGSGFEGIEFAELELNATKDAALLTLLTEAGELRSTILTDEYFVLSNDQCGIQFFGGMNDHFFTENGSTDGTTFDNTRTAVEDYQDNNNEE